MTDVRERVAANRRMLADFFDGLDDQQLDTPSLCDAWTVRDVLGHLTMPLAGSSVRLGAAVLRHRSVDRASAAVARDLARCPVAELTALLRERADHVPRAPLVGRMGQMSDGCLHLRDCARPLGLPADVGLEDWRTVLDWLSGGAPGLVPRSRVRGLRLVAIDQDWACGEGAVVSGPSEALALAVAGRRAALADLTGDGVSALERSVSPARTG